MESSSSTPKGKGWKRNNTGKKPKTFAPRPTIKKKDAGAKIPDKCFLCNRVGH